MSSGKKKRVSMTCVDITESITSSFASYFAVFSASNSHFSHVSLVPIPITIVFSSAKRHNHLKICSAQTYPKSAKINFVPYILIFRGCRIVPAFGSPHIAKIKFRKSCRNLFFAFLVAVFRQTRVLRFHACIFQVFLHLTALHSF